MSSSAETVETKEAHDNINSGDAQPDAEPVRVTDLEQQRRQAGGTNTTLQITLLMAASCMSVFLAALDTTIITTALPTISSHFNSVSGYIWIGSAFMLAAAASTPNWGKFSDIWGRKPIVLFASAIFFLGCALCGTAVSLSMLIIGRAVQGWGAGGLLTLVNIIIGDVFSERERGKYYGMIGMVWATAAALGPVIGGALTNNISWRWCFYINLPISGTAIAVTAFTLRLETPKTPFIAGIKAIDWLGSLTITGGTVMLLLGLQFGGTSFPWASSTVICLIVFGGLTVILFIPVERRLAVYPLVPLHLFARASNAAILLVVFFHGLSFTQATFFLPLYFQAVLAATPILSGVWLLPFVVSLALTAATAGVYIKRTGRYLDCIRAGLLPATIGAGLFYVLPESFSAPGAWARIITFQVVAGVGAGANFQPPLMALQSAVPAQDNASATAAVAMARNVAAAIAVVIGSVVFGAGMTSQQGGLRATLGGGTAALLTGSEAQANVFVVGTLSLAEQALVRAAFYAALRKVWIGMVCFASAGLLICVLIRKKELQLERVEVRTGLDGEEERRQIALQEARKGGKGQN